MIKKIGIGLAVLLLVLVVAVFTRPAEFEVTRSKTFDAGLAKLDSVSALPSGG